jgi:serine protease inhibitor
MYVVLPQDAHTMQTFLANLTPERFESLQASLKTQEGTIELPRFTIEYDTTLNATLSKLGMAEAFGGRANFDGIHTSPPPLAISEVRHASFLKVDEEGTEAAAVTSIGVKALAMRPGPPPFQMIVDRPFWLGIRDERDGQLLFTGIINTP